MLDLDLDLAWEPLLTWMLLMVKKAPPQHMTAKHWMNTLAFLALDSSSLNLNIFDDTLQEGGGGGDPDNTFEPE